MDAVSSQIGVVFGSLYSTPSSSQRIDHRQRTINLCTRQLLQQGTNSSDNGWCVWNGRQLHRHTKSRQNQQLEQIVPGVGRRSSFYSHIPRSGYGMRVTVALLQDCCIQHYQHIHTYIHTGILRNPSQSFLSCDSIILTLHFGMSEHDIRNRCTDTDVCL